MRTCRDHTLVHLQTANMVLFSLTIYKRPDKIVSSRGNFLQACADVSNTWSLKLQTLYWDASTSLPDQVILRIRQIQEAEDRGPEVLAGLQNLWIDFFASFLSQTKVDRYVMRLTCSE